MVVACHYLSQKIALKQHTEIPYCAMYSSYFKDICTTILISLVVSLESQ